MIGVLADRYEHLSREIRDVLLHLEKGKEVTGDLFKALADLFLEVKAGYEWMFDAQHAAGGEELRAVRSFRLLDPVIRRYAIRNFYSQFCDGQAELALKYHHGTWRDLPEFEQHSFEELLNAIADRFAAVAIDLQHAAQEL